jgi:monoamine oxidase
MMEFDTDIAVIGGGVAGLTAAWQLAAAGRQVTLFEARSRLGGRVLTAPAAPLPDRPWLDLGPAWFWPHQPHIRALVAELNLAVFAQHQSGMARYDGGGGRTPESFDASGQAAASYRLVGGMHALTEALVVASHRAPTPVTVCCGVPVRALAVHGEGVRIVGDDVTTTARCVVVAAPPRVVGRDIAFDPPLPHEVHTRLRDTVTWMGHAMKCVVTYRAPFWRAAGQSGYAVSWGGPLQEIHDAGTPAHGGDAAGYALMGFVAPRTTAAARTFRDADAAARRAAVLTQLVHLFGPDAQHALEYAEYDWARDPYSCGPQDEAPPAAHPEYGHPDPDGSIAATAWGGRLVWAGTETIAIGGGYLDGAVASGRRAAAEILTP